MSAWIVSKHHIDAMVMFLKEQELSSLPENELGKMLWDENHKSVNARYSENTQSPEYEFEPYDITQFKGVAMVKIFSCYDYQSCEHSGWEDSEAFRLCELAKDMILNEQVALGKYTFAKKYYDLPEYDNAPWGIE